MRYWQTALLVTVVLFLSSCAADVITQPPLRGDVSGFAGLKTTTGERLSDQSGITVSIEGVASTTTTGPDGGWLLRDVPAGIYDIRFSKEGYASNLFRAFQFVGGGTGYVTTVTDLIQSRRDTIRVSKVSFDPPAGAPEQYMVIEGVVLFEEPGRDTATLYLQPYYTDLSIIPATNFAIGVVSKNEDTIRIRTQHILQYGYPAGVPVDVVLTTRLNNTYYYEPNMRRRVVTDPHNLIHLRVTLPEL